MGEARQEIQRAMAVLFQPEDLINVRGLKESGGMNSALYQDHNRAAEELEKANSRIDFRALFYNIQRIKPGTRFEKGKGAKVPDIASYEWFVVDIDTVRPEKKCTNATEAEKKASYEVTNRIIAWLANDRNFPEPVIADSGNGWHLYYKLESLTDIDDGHRLLRECLAALSHQFQDYREIAEVDQSMAEPDQLTKAYGTLVRKGPHSVERPWRQSRIVSVPTKLVEVRRTQLVTLAALAPMESCMKRKGDMPALDPDFEIYDFFDHYKIPIQREEDYKGKRLYVTEVCYTSEDLHKHSGSEATGFLLGDTLGWKCFSDDCAGKTIGDVLRRLNEDNEPYPKKIFQDPPCEDDGFPVDFGDDENEPAPPVAPAMPAPLGASLTPEQLKDFLVAAEQEAQQESAHVEDMPASALYGYLGKRARDLDVPLGFGYPALLAMTAGVGVREARDRVRGTLYVALIGPIGCGKTQAMERAAQAIFLPRDHLDTTKHGSERGFIKVHENKLASPPVLLMSDEFVVIMEKCAIEHSAMAPMFCELWNREEYQVSDKKTDGQAPDVCKVRLSILGNIPCDDGEEFSRIFAKGTTRGLADRFIFGLGRGFEYMPVDIQEETLEMRPVTVPDWCYERNRSWARERRGGGRMPQMLLRVALISSAANGDLEVTPAAYEAACRFVEWQERVRAIYQPGLAEDLDGKCAEAILLTLMTQVQKGKRVIWSSLARKKKWYRKYPTRLNKVRKALVESKQIGYDEERGLVWFRDPDTVKAQEHKRAKGEEKTTKDGGKGEATVKG